jgi:hypothetical protein
MTSDAFPAQKAAFEGKITTDTTCQDSAMGGALTNQRYDLMMMSSGDTSMS